MVKRKYMEIIETPNESIVDKLSALADEAMDAVQNTNGIDAPKWYQATVLFEFSLGFLFMSYPSIPKTDELRSISMDVFKTEAIRRFGIV